jgi:type I restriction enzyme S subunit
MHSLRALNFNPRFERLCERIKRVTWRKLGELCEPGTLKRGTRFNRVDADPQFSYKLVGQKELFWLRPEGRWIAKKFVPVDVMVEQGAILVAARGTLGESELYCRATFITQGKPPALPGWQ